MTRQTLRLEPPSPPVNTDPVSSKSEPASFADPSAPEVCSKPNTAPAFSPDDGCSLAIAKLRIARDFALVQKIAYRESEAFSTRGLARRMGITQTIVQGWKLDPKEENEKEVLKRPMPAAALEVLPDAIALRMIDRIQGRRYGSAKLSLSTLTQSSEALAIAVKNGEPLDVDDALEQVEQVMRDLVLTQQALTRRGGR